MFDLLSHEHQIKQQFITQIVHIFFVLKTLLEHSALNHIVYHHRH
jgi:hypothetical protein